MKIARLIGAAGCGKTSELLSIMEGAKKALGGNPFAIGFASFTRAARAEAVSRASAAWDVPPEVLSRDGWFRTVHSVAYKMLGVQKGQLIDETKASQRWVADALKVDVRVILDDDSGYSIYAGDSSAAAALNCWEISRARVEPLMETIKRMAATGQSPPTYAECKQFINRYENAKRLEERYDFSDLLAKYAGLRFEVDGFYEVDPEGEVPPGVKAWIFDEAQDSSALVDRVCKRLAYGPEVLWTYLAGDDLQAIFGFGGSDAKHFMGWPADKQRVMPKSWRCPKPILELGERCLRQMRKGYWDRGVAPAISGPVGRLCSRLRPGADRAAGVLDRNHAGLVPARVGEGPHVHHDRRGGSPAGGRARARCVDAGSRRVRAARPGRQSAALAGRMRAAQSARSRGRPGVGGPADPRARAGVSQRPSPQCHARREARACGRRA